ncbi:putative E3 ubiquitin ligase complex SCF subunit sconB [Diplonema papillatum]|nr:putative E3 ubiquitin ligase complex SCF subunit sconB [Diplonema papillatum]
MSENALNILGRKPKHQFKQRTRVLAIAQCGSVIVGGGSSDGELALTDPTQGLREVVKGHEDSVSCVLLHENRLWTGSEDKTVRVWLTTHPFTCVGVIRSFQAGIQRLAPGPGVVYVSDESSKIMAFSADPRRKFRKEGVCIGHSAPVTHLQYAEGRLWSSSLDRTFRSWDGRNRQLACVSVPVENTTVFIYHAESFFIGTNSGCIYHLNSHGKIKASLLGHKLSIRHLVYWAEKVCFFILYY